MNTYFCAANVQEMNQTPFDELVFRLTARYGAEEAASIARIAIEDLFYTKAARHWRISDDSDRQRFDDLCERLEAGEPVQYVTGQADFFGLVFHVSPAVLIPRQETEELVDWVLEWLRGYAGVSPRVLDIGTGSGCIGIALRHQRPDIILTATDKSKEALEQARENAFRLLPSAGSCTFAVEDILHPSPGFLESRWEVIVSNPPYIPVREKAMMPEHVLAHEPALALFVDDADPLLFYRVIADLALEKLMSGGGLFFECNEFNATEVAGLLEQKGFRDVQLRRDMAGADRMVKGVV